MRTVTAPIIVKRHVGLPQREPFRGSEPGLKVKGKNRRRRLPEKSVGLNSMKLTEERFLGLPCLPLPCWVNRAEQIGTDPPWRPREAPGVFTPGDEQNSGVGKLLHFLQRSNFDRSAGRLRLEHGLFASKGVDALARLDSRLANGGHFH